MSEDLEALLREHYRRAAEGIVPDAEVVERGRRAVRPARARTWPRVLAAAAAIAVVAAVTWGLLRPVHRGAPPVTPPAPVTDVPPTTAPSSPSTHPSRRPAFSEPPVRPSPSGEAPTQRPVRRRPLPTSGRSVP